MIWSRLIPGDPSHVAAARAFVNAALDGYCDTELAELLTSELATNAVLHSASGLPDGWFVVNVTMSARRTRISVYDLGGASTPRHDGECSPIEEHGRGLSLVAALSTTMGIEGDQNGHVVWCEIPTAMDGMVPDTRKVISERHARMGARIRARRNELKISLENLGRQTGIHWSHIGRVERGQANVTVARLLILANALGVDPGDLVGD